MAGYRGQSFSEEIQLKSRGKSGRSARIIRLLIAGSRVSRKRATLMRLQAEKFAEFSAWMEIFICQFSSSFFFFLIIILRANIETIEVKRSNLFLKIVECTRNDSSENLDFSGNIDC